MTAAKTSLLSLRTLLVLMALLTGATWWIGKNVDRYVVQTSVSPQSFPGELSQWEQRENWKDVAELQGFKLLDQGISITRQEKGISSVELRAPLPKNKPAGAKLLASAELAAHGISGGDKDWHGLLYTLWFYDESGERIKKTARTVTALRGETVLIPYNREIDLPQNAVEVGIGLRVFESIGTAVMYRPQIQIVAPWPDYSKVIMGVLAAWAVYGLIVVVTLASHGRLLYAVFPIAMVAIIALGVSLPSEELLRFTKPLENSLRGVMPDLHKLGLYSFNKVGHAVTFALLSFFACVVRRSIGATWLGIICFLVLLAVLTEGVQLFFVGRSTRLLDMGIDLSGASLGIAVFFVLWLITYPFHRTRR